MKLTLSILPDEFAICQFDRALPIPNWSLQGFFAITRTQDELSIVCPQADVPQTAQAEAFKGNWRCFKIEGPLDFALTGVLVAIAVPLAAADISIFAISTYATDYVLVKQSVLERAVQVLLQAGHQVVPASLTHTAS